MTFHWCLVATLVWGMSSMAGALWHLSAASILPGTMKLNCDHHYSHCSPFIMAAGLSGEIFLVDPDSNEIRRYSAEGSLLSVWGSYGRGDGQFIFPSSLAVDGLGNIYVADMYNHRIQKFAPDGRFITKWGAFGTGEGQFSHPAAIAADAEGSVYVADKYNDRIQKFTGDGVFVMKWGSRGKGDGQFAGPTALNVSRSGSVYVADTENHRVQEFRSDGTYVSTWGSRGSDDGRFDYPDWIETDETGLIYVADSNECRIQRFTSDRTFDSAILACSSEEMVIRSLALALDRKGSLFILDINNSIIHIFDREKMTADFARFGDRRISLVHSREASLRKKAGRVCDADMAE